MANPRKLKPICFFITPIGKEGSEARKRADQIQHFILNEVLSSKYKVIRADELPQPGSITHQIIRLLHEADLVVADLTSSNANVAYELAIRHAFNRICIHLVDKADALPFDLKDERTIVFDIADIGSVQGCKEELKRTVKLISNDRFKYTSPVFRTIGVAAATAEETKGFLEEMVDKMEGISDDLSSIELSLDTEEVVEEVQKLIKGQKSIERNILDVKEALQKLSEKLG